MIKRTPQEIADFFSCYVAQDKNGEWYVFDNKPVLKRNGSWMANCAIKSLYLKYYFINPLVGHDWHTLYEPALTEKKKKLVPFDLSKKEDRDALRGKWIVDSEGGEHLMDRFYPAPVFNNPKQIIWHTCLGGADYLFNHCTFLDGSPVGKEVEE